MINCNALHESRAQRHNIACVSHAFVKLETLMIKESLDM